MLTILRRGRRELVTIDPAGPDLPSDAIWLDLHEPTPDEIAFVGRSLGIELPTREEMREIEASARVYEEVGALFLTATMLVNSDRPPPAKSEITFVLKDERLVTQRYADPSRSAACRRGSSATAPAWAPALPCSSGWSIRSWRGRPTCSSGPRSTSTPSPARSSAPPPTGPPGASARTFWRRSSGSGATATRPRATANAC